LAYLHQIPYNFKCEESQINILFVRIKNFNLKFKIIKVNIIITTLSRCQEIIFYSYVNKKKVPISISEEIEKIFKAQNRPLAYTGYILFFPKHLILILKKLIYIRKTFLFEKLEIKSKKDVLLVKDVIKNSSFSSPLWLRNDFEDSKMEKILNQAQSQNIEILNNYLTQNLQKTISEKSAKRYVSILHNDVIKLLKKEDVISFFETPEIKIELIKYFKNKEVKKITSVIKKEILIEYEKIIDKKNIDYLEALKTILQEKIIVKGPKSSKNLITSENEPHPNDILNDKFDASRLTNIINHLNGTTLSLDDEVFFEIYKIANNLKTRTHHLLTQKSLMDTTFLLEIGQKENKNFKKIP